MTVIILLTLVYAFVAIHGAWFFFVQYSNKNTKIPPTWLTMVALLFPVISHIIVYFLFVRKKKEEIEEEYVSPTYDNSHLSTNTGFMCCRTKKEIYVGNTILFEEQLGMGTRIATCEAVVRLDETCKGYYVDGFFMDGGDRVPFRWKLLEGFYSNIRLA